MAGRAWFDDRRESLVGNEGLVLCGDGERVMIAADVTPVRFLLLSGKPIGEPVAWYGPIVMHTQEELRRAFEEYDKGTFIKHRAA